MIKQYHSVYFLGIGGIGMSALARWFKSNGSMVGGYDRTPTALTAALENEGMDIHYHDDIGLIAPVYKTKETLVVFTPAIPEEHTELCFFREQGFPVKKRSEVLGMLTESFFTVAVAGTHGKTTTSSMIAHVLKEAGKNIFAFIGGILRNYETNLLLGDNAAAAPVMVVEADEFDRSFLTLKPNVAIITSMEADHLDIYGDAHAVTDSFNAFAGKIVSGGSLIYKEDLDVETSEGTTTIGFGEGKGAVRAENIRVENGAFFFDVQGSVAIENIKLGVPGKHNILNALAAFATGIVLGIKPETIKTALESFRGVKRRFEVILHSDKIIFVDDYAHHPTEIEACLTAAKELYKGKKITIVFQPHLFSRTRDFMQAFGKSLSLADAVILLPIYPARELPIPGVSSETLLEYITANEKEVVSKENLLNRIDMRDTDILVTVGAGDIDQFVEPIKNLLTHEKAS